MPNRRPREAAASRVLYRRWTSLFSGFFYAPLMTQLLTSAPPPTRGALSSPASPPSPPDRRPARLFSRAPPPPPRAPPRAPRRRARSPFEDRSKTRPAPRRQPRAGGSARARRPVPRVPRLRRATLERVERRGDPPRRRGEDPRADISQTLPRALRAGRFAPATTFLFPPPRRASSRSILLLLLGGVGVLLFSRREDERVRDEPRRGVLDARRRGGRDPTRVGLRGDGDEEEDPERRPRSSMRRPSSLFEQPPSRATIRRGCILRRVITLRVFSEFFPLFRSVRPASATNVGVVRRATRRGLLVDRRERRRGGERRARPRVAEPARARAHAGAAARPAPSSAPS